MLRLEGIHAGYGATTILHGISLNVQAGEVVTIVGANGAGKTTTLRTVAGLIKPTAGRITFEGRDITRLPAHEVVDLGITLIPEGRQLFADMTVHENLLMGAYRAEARAKQKDTLDQVLSLFPRVRERLSQSAGSLSGGEQQMVAIARGMMARPRLLMFDEPSLGLAPIIVQQVFDVIDTIVRTGATVLIVEQNVFHTLKAADRGYVLENGEIVLSDSSDALLTNDHVVKPIWEFDDACKRRKPSLHLLPSEPRRPPRARHRCRRGIGRAIALGFAARGATVGVADMNADDIAETVALIKADGHGEGLPLLLDVADYDAVEAGLADAARAIGEAFDTVVNNAGISPKHDGVAHKVWEMDPAEWSRVVAVNLSGPFNTIRALTPSMRRAERGWIVNMSSVAGKTYSPIVACHYAATKSALIGFTKHLAAELGPYGIRVNALAPGRIETPMVRGVAREINEEQVKLTPMGRLGQPEEVADTAVYLTSAESSFVTGQTIDVAGGLYMT